MTTKTQTEGAVLVAYASKHGATGEIAERIAATMRDAGCEARAVPADDVGDLEGWRAVVLGSALYMGRLRGTARHFARRHRRALEELPVWLFTSGPVDVGTTHREAHEPKAAAALAARLGARGHIMFGGRLPVEPHNFMERAMVNNTPVEQRDARDWDAIDAWARSVAAELAPTATATAPRS